MLASMCHAMPFSARAEIAVKKKSKCGLARSVLLSTTICVITVTKICHRLTRLRMVSRQHFDHCDDAIVVDKSTDNAKPHSIC